MKKGITKNESLDEVLRITKILEKYLDSLSAEIITKEIVYSGKRLINK